MVLMARKWLILPKEKQKEFDLEYEEVLKILKME